MTEKDVMVGDYFRVNRECLCIKKDTIVEVRGIDADDKLVERGLVGAAHCRPLDDDQFDGGIWLAYLEQIPLTPEILEKNGFVEKNVFAETLGIEVFGLEEFSCGISDYEDGTWLFEVFKPWSTCAPDGSPEDWGFLTEVRIPRIKHVHELQHALRLCGISKDITL